MWTLCQRGSDILQINKWTLTRVHILTLTRGARGSGSVQGCVIKALDRSGITSNTRVSPALRTGQPGITSRCQERFGNRHGHYSLHTCNKCCSPATPDVAYHGPRSELFIINSKSAGASGLIIIIIIITDCGHSPKILVHRFEEEFVAVDRSVVEDIFKIR